MLSLKRRIRNKVSIVFHEKARAPKRFLFRGVVLALVFHLLILFVFQIRVKYVDEDSSTEAPTVFLDPEETLVSLLTEPSEDICSKVTKDLHLIHNPFTFQIPDLPIFEEDSSLPHLIFQKVMLLPWSLSSSLSPSSQIIHAYPLKITLNGDLEHMILINDGFSLFKKASHDSLFCSPFFAESRPCVEFRIEIAAETTKITKATCIRELIDKRLQEVAEKILYSLRFASKKEAVRGVVTLQFSGTFDTIAPFLRNV
jgi:hypothetical protein